MDKGCEVVYDKCPWSYYRGMKWVRTKFDNSKPSKCPPGSKGYATRYCDKDDGWQEPMMTNCTSDEYYTFFKDLNDLNTNKTTLSAH